MAFKDLFIPKLVDNSPRGWIRLAGQTAVTSAATTAGMYGGIMLVAASYQLWRMKIDELEKKNKDLSELLAYTMADKLTTSDK